MHVDASTISNVGKYIWGAEFGETEGDPNHGGRFLLSRKTLYESQDDEDGVQGKENYHVTVCWIKGEQ